MRQNLNNVSQALHNIFEFFREAEPQYENKFFVKIRFFSVVINTEDLAIRIYRSIRKSINGSNQNFIISEYSLRFEYREFCNMTRNKFDRKIVLKIFEKILLGYEANKLYLLFHNTVKVIVDKLKKDSKTIYLKENKNFYRYR
jgi:hypothetical protein